MIRNMALRSVVKRIVRCYGNRTAKIASLRKRLAGVERIHAGCGRYRVPEWLNIELMSRTEVPYGRILRAGEGGSTLLLNFDLTAGVPIFDNQATHLYSSHFIEHINLEQGRRFLSESFRVLTPGGRIRITCPALDIYVQRYQERDAEFFRRVYQAGASYPGLVTPGHILMGQVHGWGHQWVYDHESMAFELERAGFCEIVRSDFRASDFPDLEQLEPDTEARTIQSLYMEAYKR